MHLMLFRFVFDSTPVRCRITVEWESNCVESRLDRSCNQHLIAARRQQLRGRCRWVASDGSHKTRSRDVGDYSDRYRNFIRRELLPCGVVSTSPGIESCPLCLYTCISRVATEDNGRKLGIARDTSVSVPFINLLF